MYYILNGTNKIIAADDSLLSLCGVTHIDELSSQIVTGDIALDFLSDASIAIMCQGEKATYSTSRTSLSSMLGDLTLVRISLENETETSIPNNIDDTISIFSDTQDDVINISSDTHDEASNLIESIVDESEEKETADTLEINENNNVLPEIDSSDDEITFGDHLNLDTNILNQEDEEDLTLEKENVDVSIDDSKEDESTSQNSSLDMVEDTPLTLDLTDNDLTLDSEKETEISDIMINITEVSHKIGISPDDYNSFLNEFIDTALGLEKDLQSADTDSRTDAVDTLSSLSEVLHLPLISDILESIGNSDSDEGQLKSIESFYTTLSHITTTSASSKEQDDQGTHTVYQVTKQENTEDEKLELFEEPEVFEEEVKPTKAPNARSFGSISLQGITPKHFDFQMEEAANDLSLPVELIEEFVHDFIEQAHIETDKMLVAYEAGDLDAIQKIGHLLKGASSNLRINALSDTLYKIQFCEDSKNLDVLIKDYWAHFLSFEKQIDMKSK